MVVGGMVIVIVLNLADTMPVVTVGLESVQSPNGILIPM